MTNWLVKLEEDDNYWSSTTRNIPGVICHSYQNLRKLAGSNRIYGVILQIKDVYELIAKIPSLMSLVLIENNNGFKENNSKDYYEIVEQYLNNPMSMGSWESLMGTVYSIRNSADLPSNITNILKLTRKLFAKEITGDYANIVKWRNDTIGHGVLKFEQDDSYRREIESILLLLKDYFEKVSSYYEGIDFDSVLLKIGDKSWETTNYVNNQDTSSYLFESYFKRKEQTKYSSYYNGQSLLIKNDYFAELIKQSISASNIDSAINDAHITREENQVLELLTAPDNYIVPDRLIDIINTKLERIDKGVITIFMERGTGKSAFANKMSGLFNKTTLIDDSFSRIYHTQNAYLRGFNDFINSINFSFTHSYNPGDDIYGGEDNIPRITGDSQNPAEDMAKLLNHFHKWYKREYTILVIDGIDELTEDTRKIIEYIPDGNMLKSGVFVILLSRFKDEETLTDEANKLITSALEKTDEIIEIRRDDPANTEVLNWAVDKYFGNNIAPEEKQELLNKSDNRFLYLKAILAVKNKTSLAIDNETEFIRSYMDYICSFYSEASRRKLRKIAVQIALFPRISLKEYQEYITCQNITYEFIGLLNNLMPLISVIHEDGESRYEFADQAYNTFIINNYLEITQEVVNEFYHASNDIVMDINFQSFSGLTDESFHKASKEDIIFTINGFINIWKYAPNCCLKHEKNVKTSSLAFIYSDLSSIDFGKHGIGSFLAKSLIDLKCQILYLGITNTGPINKETFDIWLNNMRNNYAVKYLQGFWMAENIDKLIDAIFENSSDIREWFWLLSCIPNTYVYKKVIELDVLENFVDYISDETSENKETSLIALDIVLEGMSEDLKEKYSHLKRDNRNYNNYLNIINENLIKMLQDKSGKDRLLTFIEESGIGYNKIYSAYYQVYKENWADEITKIMPDLIEKCNKSKYDSMLQLSYLMGSLINYLADTNQEYRAIEYLYMLMDIDYIAYFSSSNTQNVRDTLLVMAREWLTPDACYGTDSAYYLLRLLSKAGRTSEVITLMERIEKGFDILDEHSYIAKSLKYKIEVKKVEFFCVRKELNYKNDFDSCLEADFSSREKYLYNELNSISPKTDWEKFHFELDLLLEYYTISERFEESRQHIRNMIAILREYNGSNNEIIKHSVNECLRIMDDTLNHLERF